MDTPSIVAACAPRSLTVAGAVQASHLFPVSSVALEERRGHLATESAQSIKHFQNKPLKLDAAGLLKHSAAVDAEFNALEAKVAQFVGVCERLRAENHDLRQQLASAKNDAKRLNERIEGAKSKLETLLARLPD
jgi:cell division protein ZapB